MATSTKRGRDNAHHFLLVLANHQPIVAALRYVDREVCPFVSDNAASFRIGEMTVRPGQTRGFRVVSPSSIDRTQTVVSVDSIELLGPHAPGPRPSTDRSIPDAGPDCGDTVFWAPLAECKPAHRCCLCCCHILATARIAFGPSCSLCARGSIAFTNAR